MLLNPYCPENTCTTAAHSVRNEISPILYSAHIQTAILRALIIGSTSDSPGKTERLIALKKHVYGKKYKSYDLLITGDYEYVLGSKKIDAALRFPARV